MSPDKEILKPSQPANSGPRVTRRRFLEMTTGLGVGFILAPNLVLATEPPKLESRRIAVANQFKEFEGQKEDHPLTVEEAKEKIPILAQLYEESMKTPYSAEEIAEAVFIVHGKPPDRDDFYYLDRGLPELIYQHPAVINFQTEYSVPMTQELAEWIVRGLGVSLGNVQQFSEKTMVFLYLDNINDRERMIKNEQSIRGEYEEANSFTKATPAEVFRSKAIHEIRHFDVFTTYKPLDDEFLAAWYRLQGQQANGSLRVEFKNLVLRFTRDLPGGPLVSYQTVLDELMTEIAAHAVGYKNDLSYTVSYAGLIDYLNLQKILEQAKIGIDDLSNISRQSQFKEFLLLVANAAENKLFESQDIEKSLDFSLALFSKNGRLAIPEWGYVKAFFPKVITEPLVIR